MLDTKSLHVPGPILKLVYFVSSFKGQFALTVCIVILGINQVTAQVNIGHNGVILEMAPNITVRAGEIRRRSAPRVRLGLLARDIRRNAIPRKLPHADAGIAPLDGHDTAALVIKGDAKRALVARDAAAGSAVVLGKARALLGVARHLALDAHGAALGGVQGHHVALVALVDGFHDIDLAVVGPVGAVG